MVHEEYSADRVSTVKVAAPEKARGFKIINAGDFDPAKHTVFGEASAPQPVPPAADEDFAGDEASPLTVSRGARGLWFIKRDGKTIGSGYAREDDALAAKAAMELPSDGE